MFSAFLLQENLKELAEICTRCRYHIQKNVSDKGLKGTVVNQALSSLIKVSLEILLTVHLRATLKINFDEKTNKNTENYFIVKVHIFIDKRLISLLGKFYLIFRIPTIRPFNPFPLTDNTCGVNVLMLLDSSCIN